MKFNVEWYEKTPCWAQVEANSLEEAKEKAKTGQFIPGTVDSDPACKMSGMKIRKVKE